MLLHVKLTNGTDLIGVVLDESNSHVSLEKPIEVHISESNGFFIKDWLFLSEDKTIVLDKKHVMFTNLASENAMKYYSEFFQKKPNAFSEDDDSLLDIFELLAESKSSIKH